MREPSSLDLHFLVREWQSLVGARFDKAYQADRGAKRELLLSFHKTGEGKRFLRILLPGFAYLARAKGAYPMIPPGFTMFLRKRLSGARVAAVEQLGCDRVFTIGFIAKRGEEEEATKLIVELLAPGNVVVIGKKAATKKSTADGTAGQDVILHLMAPQAYKDRTIRGGIPYEPPPTPPDVKTLSVAALAETVALAGKDSLVKCLAMGLGVGGTYAELACTRAGIEKSKAHFTKKDAVAAVEEFKALLDETPAPRIVNNEYVFFPANEFGVPAPDCNAALDEILTTDEEVAEVKAPKKDKLADMLRAQEAQLVGFEKAAAESQRKGELLYEQYAELKPLLEKLRAVRKKQAEFDEVLKHPLIKGYDPKTGMLTIEIKE